MTSIKPTLPLAVAKEWFSYDQKTGNLIWRRSSKSITKGKIAGTVKSRGYRIVNFRGKSYPVHRIVWLLCTGQDPYPHCVDHVNGDRADNCFENLRLATVAENTRNQKLHPKNTSGYKGVSYIKRTGKWDARIKKEYKQYCLGVYSTKEEAYAAYCKAAQALHGDFARFV